MANNFLRDMKTNIKLFLMGYNVRTIWGETYKNEAEVLGTIKGLL